MKNTFLLIFALLLTFLLSGCSQNTTNPTESLNPKTSQNCISLASNLDESLKTFLLNPTLNNVVGFEKLLGDFPTGYQSDTCYNVTPYAILEDYDFQIFKFDTSCETFLLYEEKIYPLGRGFGGYGVTSFAIFDTDADGNAELYFTFSWGSGIHRSQIGYFDFAKKTTTIFDFASFDEEIMIGVDNEDKLGIYSSVFTVDDFSFVDVDMSPKTQIAYIVFDSDEIVLLFA